MQINDVDADLIFWRHADAQINSPSGLDADRRLTAKGLSDAKQSAEWLAQQLPADVQIFCSPILRCQQTVSALKAFRPEVVIHNVDFLSTDADAKALLQEIRRITVPQCALFAGHQPNLGLTIGELVGDVSQSDVQKNAIWWLRPQKSEANASYVVLKIQQNFI